MGKYNFDEVIDRRGSGAMKYEALKERYGRSDITPLWIADMEFATPPEVVEAMCRRMEHPVYGYPSTPDSFWQSIIGWLRRRHGFEARREDMAFVPGIVRGVAYAVNFFTRPGDKIVIQNPVYHPFRLVSEGNGRVVVNNPLVLLPDGAGYRMDLEGLEHIFATQRPKMMVLCNPHNPGGMQWDADSMRSLASLAKKYGVLVLSDEIHADLMLFGNRHIPFASVSPEAAEVSLTFGAPSKTFNIPGLTSSWMIASNPKIRDPFFHWMEVNEFSMPTFMATVSTEAAYTKCDLWLDELIAYLEGNIEAVERFCADNMPQIKPMRPQASYLVWLDCRDLGMTQSGLADFFVNRAGLALNDGTMFGSEGEGFMRLNAAMPRESLLEALGKIKTALKDS